VVVVLPQLTVVMPVYNEIATVVEAVGQVLRADLPVVGLELVLVDDGSTDGTRELLRDTEWPDAVRVLFHEENQGKGAAVRTGLRTARGTFSVVVDADLELDAADVARLLPPLLSGEAQAVLGARRFPLDSARKLRYRLGNRGVTAAANLLYGGSLADIMTAYKAMSTELFRSLPLRERGFGIEPEIVAHLLRTGAVIREVQVSYTPRDRKEGKKLTMWDGFRVLRTLARCRIDRRSAAEPAPLLAAAR
jgi:glycosyltransferase involved in cell wall biosynthesis